MLPVTVLSLVPFFQCKWFTIRLYNRQLDEIEILKWSHFISTYNNSALTSFKPHNKEPACTIITCVIKQVNCNLWSHKHVCYNFKRTSKWIFVNIFIALYCIEYYAEPPPGNVYTITNIMWCWVCTLWIHVIRKKMDTVCIFYWCI